MSIEIFRLDRLGWSAFFAQQLRLEDLESSDPARVCAVHRGSIALLGERGPITLSAASRAVATATDALCVGDWVLVEREAPRIGRVLERRSVVQRHAAGMEQRVQPIAANLDTLFVLSSCDFDFNLSRLERYLTVAREGRVDPVLILTKSDLAPEPEPYLSQARTLGSDLPIVQLDATSPTAVETLQPWLASGQTVACVGSSGVGKSTLVNTLLGGDAQQRTQQTRASDSKGRHTTTARELFALPGGAWVIDTPGMRELKIGAAERGVSETFADLETLAARCRFRDCSHEQQPGCALEAAVASGSLDTRRLASYLKLRREARQAGRSSPERRADERRVGRINRNALKLSYRLKGQSDG